MKKGLPFRDAHETVAHAVKAAQSHACDLSELPLTVLQGFHPQIEKDVYECLSLRGSLNARNTLGGTAPAQVRAQLARHRAQGLGITAAGGGLRLQGIEPGEVGDRGFRAQGHRR